jgi:photosystem II stability/assembly factor-like uncharacterized protein
MRKRVDRDGRRGIHWLMPMIVSCMMWGCGGDGGNDTPPTPLPHSLQINLPQNQHALAVDLVFSSSLVGSGTGLSYRWEFGDGATSALSSPSHRYSKPGVYQVRLVITNEAGSTVSATGPVSVGDVAVVQGRLCSGPDLTGWCWQRPLPQGNALRDYAWVDDTHAWAVGDAGAVMATRDGGVTWSAQTSGTAVGLRRVTFIDRQVGWAAGDAGQLLRTRDGGATWQRVSLGLAFWTVQELGVGDANTAWVRDGGEAYITTDGGTQWRKIIAPGPPIRVIPVSATDIWATPGGSTCTNSTALQHSLDGGATWTQVSLPPLPAHFVRCIADLQAIDANNLLAFASDGDGATPWAMEQSVWRTSDRGATWHKVKRPSDISGNEAINYRLSTQGAVFVTSDRAGPLRRTTDDGANWQVIALPANVNNNFSGIVGSSAYRAYSANRIWLKAPNEQAYFTNDGGATWSIRVAADRSAFPTMALWFFDSRHGLTLNGDGSVSRTTDGGQTWVSSTRVGESLWKGVQFLPDGSAGWAFEGDRIWRAMDRGATWVRASHISDLLDLNFIDAQRGWAVSSRAIYRTLDGGQNWQAVVETDSVGLKSVRFADALHGVAVGPAGFVFVTSDAGASWRARPTGSPEQLNRLAFIDARHVVAVGNTGSIVRSTDGGETWRSAPSVTRLTLNDVRFASANVGYAVGDEGLVLATRDGGVSWTRSATNTWTNLLSVFFVDEVTGWASGGDGAVIATVNGGR